MTETVVCIGIQMLDNESASLRLELTSVLFASDADCQLYVCQQVSRCHMTNCLVVGECTQIYLQMFAHYHMTQTTSWRGMEIP